MSPDRMKETDELEKGYVRSVTVPVAYRLIVTVPVHYIQYKSVRYKSIVIPLMNI